MIVEQDAVDVLVIGAGASGGAFTWSLSESGIDVMCLEQGDWIDPKSYPTIQDDWELHRQTDFNPDPNGRGLPQDYPVNNSESPIVPLMYNAVGGSTIHWSAHFPRLHPSDYRVRTLDGVAEDWPLTYEQLEPFYDLNDRMNGVAGIIGDPAYPQKSPRQMPPLNVGKLGATVVAGFDKLGWHWWPSDSAINTVHYDGRVACNGCGPCDIGCYQGAKSSTDLNYWPKALANGAKLATQARVREITVGGDGLADGVVYYDAEGQERRQKARIVVVACNGVGTPRLLLNSTSSRFPHGLANSNGLVGKNLMFHPVAVVTGIFDTELEGHKGPIGCKVFSHEFYETDLSRGFVRGYGMQVVGSSGPLNTALGGFTQHLVPWGKYHRRVFSQRHGRTATIVVLGEDLPEPHNRVVLDPELTDGHDIPAPKVIYEMSENSTKMLAHGAARASDVLKAAGANDVLVNTLLQPAGWHLMGTTPMGTNASKSVVDEWGSCHDVKNMFIIDGSIFVTAGAVNPTSAIQALGLYIADYVKKNARNLVE